MDFKVISNAGPIIHLTRIGKLRLLKNIFGKIAIPEAVKFEIVERGKQLGKPDAQLIEKEIGDWIEIIKSPSISEELIEKSGIHQGEIAVILLAKELNLPVLIDDAPARNFADLIGLEVIGSIGVLIKATQDGFLSLSEALSSLERLSEIMWLNASVYEQARKTLQSLTK